MATQPSNSEIMEELETQRFLLEKLLAAVPGAVSSEESKREERSRQEWGLALAKRSRLKSSR